MAIYKPNGFYPYLQEVDLENLEGNLFSCQVNTDGAMCAGGKIKIYSPDSDVVLYDNIYQFQKIENNTIIADPIPNGGIAEFKIEPYELTVDWIQNENFLSTQSLILTDIDFIYLTPDEDYSVRKNYCPYNFFNIYKDYKKYKLIFKTVKNNEEKIIVVDIKNISIDNENNTITLLNLDLSELEDLIIDNNEQSSILDENIVNNNEESANLDESVFGNYEIHCYISLKNDQSYLWEVELFEHYFQENYNKSTFITDGYVTGSTQTVLWYDQDTQFDEIITQSEKIDVDNYIEVIATSDNSDLFKKEILDGYVDTGNLTIYNENSDDSTIIINTTPTISPESPKFQFLYFDGISKNWYVFYQVADGEKTRDFYYSINLDFSNSSNYYRYYFTTWGYECWYYSGGTQYFENPYKWNFVTGIQENINNNERTFDGTQAVIGNICYRLSNSYSRYNWGDDSIEVEDPESTINGREVITNTDYARHPFFLPVSLDNKDEPFYVCSPVIENITNPGYATVTINGKDYWILKLECIDINSNIITNTQNNRICSYYINNTNMANYINNGNTVNTVRCVYTGDINLDIHNQESNEFNKSDLAKILNNLVFIDCCYNSNNNINITNQSNYANISIDYISLCCELQDGKWNYFSSLSFYSSDWDNRSRGWTCSIMEKNDISKKEQIYQSNKKNEANINEFYNIKIFINPILTIDFYSSSGQSGYSISNIILRLDKIMDESFYPFSLSENSVKFKNIDDYYLYLTSNDESGSHLAYMNQRYKISNYYVINQKYVITLEDLKVGEILWDLLGDNDPPSITYKIQYKKRQQISWVTKQVGDDKKYNKIELKEPFDIDLKNNTEVYLYSTGSNNSYNSFSAVKDIDLNVDNIYIRFPGYEGKDASGNEIKDNKEYFIGLKSATYNPVYDSSGKMISDDTRGIKGWFYSGVEAYSEGSPITWDENVYQNVNLYGKQVRASAFDKQYDDGTLQTYCKLFKITSYDPETGELVFAGGLERKILDSDKYEIWQGNVIEGSSNQYDITEVIRSYTRIYPAPDEYDNETNTVDGEPLIDKPIMISNSTNDKIFIQPNVNFYNNEYNLATILFKNFSQVRNLLYQYEIENKFNFFEKSIEKLDNSQWIIRVQPTLNFTPIPGDVYELNIDTTKSVPANYFYAKNTPQIDIKFADYDFIKRSLQDNSFRYNFEELKNSFTSIIENTDECEGHCGIVTAMDVYFMASYRNCDTPIKRYRYKIYDENMNLIKDTDYIYDNLLVCDIKGLMHAKHYLLDFECENQDGKIDNYKQQIYIQYATNQLTNISCTIVNDNKRNCLVINVQKENENNENIILSLYKRTTNDLTWNWVTDISLNSDPENIYDYNVRNHIEYEYMLVKKEEASSSEHHDIFEYYTIEEIFCQVCYNDWSIVDIIDEKDGIYYVYNDVWHFKYNLESNDLSINNSITTYDTLSKYPQFGYGKTNYISSGVSCLLGDVGTYKIPLYKNLISNQIIEKKVDGYHESVDNEHNNITKFLKWKDFVNNDNQKLLKDIKGNKWIVRINEKPVTKNNDTSIEQMYTISFDWTEVMDSNNISIIEKIVE